MVTGHTANYILWIRISVTKPYIDFQASFISKFFLPFTNPNCLLKSWEINEKDRITAEE